MSAFNTMLSSSRARNFGGTSSQVACEPYLSGYCFIKWYLPDPLRNILSTYKASSTNDQTTFTDLTNAADVLSAACTSVTPPGQSIDFLEYHGSCGVIWNNPSKVRYGNNVTIKYTEFSGIPIFRIHKAWFDMIRDSHQGLPISQTYTEQQLFRGNWSGNLLYWTTKPDGCTVEYYAAYSGVTPEKDNQENFASDIANVDKVELDITYRIDHIWTDKWVFDAVNKLAKEKPYGGTGATLWSRDGVIWDREPSSTNEMSSKL